MTQIDDGVDRLLLAPEGNNLISVLLVEDDASTSTVMIKLLASLGYKVQSAPCIADALRIVESGPVDVVLSDIGLPDGNGYELMTEIRKRCPAVGIAVSGYNDEEDIDRSHLAGFSRHLVKPIDFNQLKSILAGIRSL